MDLFQILILLFILYPLLQKLFGKGNKKGEHQRPHRKPTGQQGEPWQQEQRSGNSSSGSDNWEDALRELESIFTGETTPKRSESGHESMPLPPASEPAQTGRTTGTPGRTPATVTGESTQLRRQRELQERFEKTKRKSSILDEIADEDNPIYQPIDEGAIVEDEEADYSEQTRSFLGLDNTRELQRHLMLKEILDKPLSKRNRNRDLPF
jgi:hypothetical protein